MYSYVDNTHDELSPLNDALLDTRTHIHIHTQDSSAFLPWVRRTQAHTTHTLSPSHSPLTDHRRVSHGTSLYSVCLVLRRSATLLAQSLSSSSASSSSSYCIPFLLISHLLLLSFTLLSSSSFFLPFPPSLPPFLPRLPLLLAIPRSRYHVCLRKYEHASLPTYLDVPLDCRVLRIFALSLRFVYLVISSRTALLACSSSFIPIVHGGVCQVAVHSSHIINPFACVRLDPLIIRTSPPGARSELSAAALPQPPPPSASSVPFLLLFTAEYSSSTPRGLSIAFSRLDKLVVRHLQLDGTSAEVIQPRRTDPDRSPARQFRPLHLDI